MGYVTNAHIHTERCAWPYLVLKGLGSQPLVDGRQVGGQVLQVVLQHRLLIDERERAPGEFISSSQGLCCDYIC